MADDFEEIWNAFPRKVAKKDARRAWARLNDAQKFAAREALSIHVRYWKLAGRTMETTPYLSSWLNGERWEDELEMPQSTGGEWWRSGAGIEAKGRELGITARPGESHDDLKARILAKVGG